VWGSIDGFTERNSQTYHGLTVRGQDFTDNVFTATFEGAYDITSNARLIGKLAAGTVSGARDREVQANFTGDARSFSVVAPGFSAEFATLDMRLDMMATDSLSLSLNGQAGLMGAAAGSHRVGASLNLRF
jgi:hypothetical protein